MATSSSSSFYSNDDSRVTSGKGTTNKIDGSRFYGQYNGHPLEDLRILLPALRETSESLIWTAGDSSLDNKFWFQDPKPAVEGAYQNILDPPTMNADVTYWLNQLASERARARTTNNDTNNTNTIATINTAIEATTIQHRTWKLLDQDEFIRDNILPGDTLVVSIGGNDVGNSPTPCTICATLSLVKMSHYCLEPPCCCKCCTCCSGIAALPCNEYCWGCGPVAMASCLCAYPPCLGYMNHLLGSRVQHYIKRLTSKTKPKRILVCMIYYLDETPSPSWANAALKCLGYDDNPERLQYLIRNIYTEATSKIKILGVSKKTIVIPVPLFEVLDGKNSDDYVVRVEPSSQGGRKMAEYLLDIIERDEQEQDPSSNIYQDMPKNLAGSSGLVAPVESSHMVERG